MGLIELISAAEVRANNRAHLERKREERKREERKREDALKAAQIEISQLRREARQKDRALDVSRAEIVRLNQHQESLVEELDGLRVDLGRMTKEQASLMQLKPKARLLMGDIIAEVAKHLGVPDNEILSDRRDKHSVNARQISMWMIRRITGKGLAEIGRKMHRDHSTVLSNVRAVDKQCRQVASFNTEIIELRAQIEKDLDIWAPKEAADLKTKAIDASV